MKIKPFQPLKLSQYPKRSTRENRLIDKNPWGNKDRDRVPNYFDCKPLNRKKQDFLQNLTSGASQVPLKIAQQQQQESQSQRTISQMSTINAAAATAAIRNPMQMIDVNQTIRMPTSAVGNPAQMTANVRNPTQ